MLKNYWTPTDCKAYYNERHSQWLREIHEDRLADAASADQPKSRRLHTIILTKIRQSRLSREPVGNALTEQRV
jgi:hypothetical protein